MSTHVVHYSPQDEFEAFDSLPKPVRDAYNQSIIKLSAAEAKAHWANPFNRAFGMAKGETVATRVIKDIQAVDREELAAGVRFYASLARRPGRR